MAKAPSKRRGITLTPRVEGPVEIDTPPPADSKPSSTEAAPVAPETPASTEPGPISEQLSALHQLTEELEQRSLRQGDQLRQQLRQSSRMLEQQRDQINEQTRHILALQRARATEQRTGFLLTLLLLVSLGALGYYNWQEIQGVSEDWQRMSTAADRVAGLESLDQQLTTLRTNVNEVEAAVSALDDKVAGIQTKLDEQHLAVQSAPHAPSAPAAANTRTAANPYRSMYPGRRW